MSITFASPLYLLLLLLLPVVWLLGRRSLAGLDVIRRRLSLGLRLGLVTLIVLALAEVEWRDLTQKVEVIFVVDHSRSIPEENAQQALDLVNHARDQMDPRRDLGKVVVFGKEGLNDATLRADQPPTTRFASDIDRNYSNLEAGIQRALEAFEVDARGRIIVISDGNETAGDARNAVARAREAGVPVDVIPLGYQYGQELLVEKVVLPNEAKIGEPFSVRVLTRATARTEANIHLWREGALVETRRVTLEQGDNLEVFQLEVPGPGFFRVEAVVEPLDRRADQLFQNNTAHGFVYARGKAQILYVHDDADPDAAEGRHLLDALQAEEIRVKVIPAVDFPLEVGELQSYDAIILDDVSRPSFSLRQQQGIETAVADMGLGLIMIGGARSFGAGEWKGSPVEKALPVEMDIKQEEVIPDGALIMIIHSCEFPDGNAMAIKVAKKAVDSLSAKDTVGALIYGNGAEWAVKPVRARNKVAIKRALHQMQIGDMPDFDEIFRMAIIGLKKVNASVKHMIVLSDGDPSPPAPSLLKECRQRRITVSTICYFAHGGSQGPSVDVMKRIANITGGKYYYMDDAQALPKIFLKESKRVARSLIVNRTFVPARRTESPILTGFDAFPEVTGYVLTEPKERAEVALVSPDNAPVLAHWQYGVGKALAFTSDAKPRWATAWVSWEGFRSFWAQAVRWVSKDVQESVFQVATRLDGANGQIVLDAVTADGELVDGLTVTARVTDPAGGESVEVRLQQRGAGRYEGDFPVSDVGTYSVSVLSLDEEGNRRHSVTTGLVFPYSDEFKRLSSKRSFLEQLAERGKGRVIEPEQLLSFEVDPWDRSNLGEKEALEERWPLALALAVLVFLLDVGVRRVAIDWDKLFAKAVGLVTRRGGDEPRTMDRLRERKAAVREAQAVTVAKFEAPVGGQHAPVEVAGAEQALPRAEAGTRGPRPSAPRPQAPAGDEAEGGYTNRLLAAKRRARRDIQETTDGDASSSDSQ